MELSRDRQQGFNERGFVQVPGAIPPRLVDAALRAINHSLGEGVPREEMAILRAQSYCAELQHDPVITGLFNDSPVRAMAESLIGEGKIQPVNGAQIALRFPSFQEPPPLRP